MDPITHFSASSKINEIPNKYKTQYERKRKRNEVREREHTVV
jgi:hypothetical protein